MKVKIFSFEYDHNWLSEYQDLLKDINIAEYTLEDRDEKITVVGIISGLQIRNSKKIKKYTAKQSVLQFSRIPKMIYQHLYCKML